MLLRNIIFLTVIGVSHFGFAQSGSSWGSGQWGGQQGCSYQPKAGQGAVSEDDTLNEYLEEIAEIKNQIKTKKQEQKRLTRLAERSASDIERAFSGDYSEFILQHMQNKARCSEYQGLQTKSDIQGHEGGSDRGPNSDMLPVSGFTPSEWSKYCDRNNSGSVAASLCSDVKFTNRDEARPNVANCKKSLTEYRKNYSASEKLQNDIQTLDSRLERSQEDLKQAQRDAREELRNAKSEGDYCEDCARKSNSYSYQKPQTDWGNVISNVGTGLAATYMGYKTNEMVADYNSNIGWPTQASSSALSYGFPYLQAGLYGAIGGGVGQGGFGCGSGGMNGSPSNAFGYPSSMMSGQMGGGMFMSGLGPWGSSGYGNMGMGNTMTGYGSMMGGGMMTTGYGSMMGSGMMTTGYGSMMSGGGMMMDSSSVALQAQMMQMQMQAYQSNYSQQMSKYQTMSSLQTELSSLMQRIQQVQYGYGTTSSYYGIGSATGTSTYNTGVIPAPSLYYDSGNYSTGAIPAPIPTITSTYYGR